MDKNELWNRYLAPFLTKKRYREYTLERYQPFWGSTMWRIKDEEGRTITEDVPTFEEAKKLIDLNLIWRGK